MSPAAAAPCPGARRARFFNTAGPVVAADHYCIPPLQRVNLGPAPGIIRDDDLQYVRDLGLVAVDPPVRVANPIYREVIPRAITWTTQEFLPHDPAWYVKPGAALQAQSGWPSVQRPNGTSV